MVRAAVRPWFCRLVDALPAPPFGAAALIVTGLLLAHALALLGNLLLASAPPVSPTSWSSGAGS